MKRTENQIREVLKTSEIPSYKMLKDSICMARKNGVKIDAYFNNTTDDEGFVQSIMIAVDGTEIIYKDHLKLTVGTKPLWSDQFEQWFRKMLLEILQNGYIHMYEATQAIPRQ